MLNSSIPRFEISTISKNIDSQKVMLNLSKHRFEKCTEYKNIHSQKLMLNISIHRLDICSTELPKIDAKSIHT